MKGLACMIRLPAGRPHTCGKHLCLLSFSASLFTSLCLPFVAIYHASASFPHMENPFTDYTLYPSIEKQLRRTHVVHSREYGHVCSILRKWSTSVPYLATFNFASLTICSYGAVFNLLNCLKLQILLPMFLCATTRSM